MENNTIENKKDWKEIHQDFTKELQKEWEDRGFSYEQTEWWIDAGLKVDDADYAQWLRDVKDKNIEWVSDFLKYGDERELRKEYEENKLKQAANDKTLEEKEEIINYKNILLIGRTGNGKSTLANVLVNKNDDFEEVFKESQGSASETKEIKDEIFEINGEEYRVIDTPGLGDTNLSKIETLQEIAKVYDKVKSGLSQVLFVNGGRFTPEEVETYNLLKEILFDDNISKYTTIIRTNFPDFEEENRCKEDIKSLLREDNKAITEMIESCNKRIIHVDNPSINIKGKRGERDNPRNKEVRKDSRERLLNHLLECDEVYIPENIEILNRIEQKERYKAFGLCQECNKTNTWYRWCKTCNAEHFRQNFGEWVIGNRAIDEFIQKYQLTAINKYGVLEWIPYEKFRDIEYLATGGFGNIYKAEWSDRQISYRNIKENNWERDKFYPDKVVLKNLRDSRDITTEFLREITYYKLFKDDYDGIVKCFGISQDPDTGNYLMVMDYIKGGSLRQYLNNYYKKLDFYNKLGQLLNIAKGLNNIHRQELVHRDFHSGNILISNSDVCLITDLGLSRPANETDEEKVFGVLPYVAPEVLLGKGYSQASDIYSFGIIAYEMISGLPPYPNLPHDSYLGLSILKGLRPDLNNIKVPELLKNLINSCWDAELSKRPTASKLFKIINVWQNEIKTKKDTKFYYQYQMSEAFNENPNDEIKTASYQTHPQAIYTSRLLDFKNLPEPQNSKQINEQFYKFYNSQPYTSILDFPTLVLNEFIIPEKIEQNEAQIQIPPK